MLRIFFLALSFIIFELDLARADLRFPYAALKRVIGIPSQACALALDRTSPLDLPEFPNDKFKRIESLIVPANIPVAEREWVRELVRLSLQLDLVQNKNIDLVRGQLQSWIISEELASIRQKVSAFLASNSERPDRSAISKFLSMLERSPKNLETLQIASAYFSEVGAAKFGIRDKYLFLWESGGPYLVNKEYIRTLQFPTFRSLGPPIFFILYVVDAYPYLMTFEPVEFDGGVNRDPRFAMLHDDRHNSMILQSRGVHVTLENKDRFRLKFLQSRLNFLEEAIFRLKDSPRKLAAFQLLFFDIFHEQSHQFSPTLDVLDSDRRLFARNLRVSIPKRIIEKILERLSNPRDYGNFGEPFDSITKNDLEDAFDLFRELGRKYFPSHL